MTLIVLDNRVFNCCSFQNVSIARRDETRHRRHLRNSFVSVETRQKRRRRRHRRCRRQERHGEDDRGLSPEPAAAAGRLEAAEADFGVGVGTRVDDRERDDGVVVEKDVEARHLDVADF